MKKMHESDQAAVSRKDNATEITYFVKLWAQGHKCKGAAVPDLLFSLKPAIYTALLTPLLTESYTCSCHQIKKPHDYYTPCGLSYQTYMHSNIKHNY